MKVSGKKTVVMPSFEDSLAGHILPIRQDRTGASMNGPLET